MKVYLVYTPDPEDPPIAGVDVSKPANFKLKLPASWSDGPVQKVLELFADSYNRKFPSANVSASTFAATVAGLPVPASAILKEHVAENDEIGIVCAHAHTHTHASSRAHAAGDGRQKELCRNFGCGKQFDPAENHASACQHHIGPPQFWEGRKRWTCCPSVSAWDWDEFMAIPGCVTTAHSSQPPEGATIAPSPTVAAAAAAAAAADASPAPVRSIADYNVQNAGAVTGVTSAAATIKNVRTKKVVREDGRVQCWHMGCKQFFMPDTENGPTACKYHAGGPIFHEGIKKWSCCPHATFLEFDEFLAHPGCTVGPHECGTDESEAS